MLLTISYLESAYPITLAVDYFVISTYLCLLYININKIKFTYEKLETVKFGFSILDMFNQVLLNLFTFLINATNQ